MSRAPIGCREGISPRKVVLAAGSIVPSGPVYFAGRAGDSAFSEGDIIPAGTVLPSPTLAWFHPDVPAELPIPFDYTIIYEDEHLIVVDKPHFLPTTSNGRIIRETVQTRLRVQFGEDDIVPLHRLDRLTAGIVLCSRNPETRGNYQRLFQDKKVRKHYQALTTRPLAIDDIIELGMRKDKGSRQVLVDPDGTPTVTRVQAHGYHADLWPVTGHTHQLRVLLNHLGAPIRGDDTYPVDRGLELYDFELPMSLLHASCEFTDPLSGKPRIFRSKQSLGSTL